ncbi:MAG: DUF349 domain-containing protein [Bacteroidota bacterium]|nr:DUF349 domain-containing protein [Bacteroidota bacterium]MDP4205286.1 DUF349 domain-containing protein [Bacteroidota bacterium]
MESKDLKNSTEEELLRSDNSSESADIKNDEPNQEATPDEKVLEEMAIAAELLDQQETHEEWDDHLIAEPEATAVPAETSVDYSGLSEFELITALRELIEKQDVNDIKDHLDSIRINFYKSHKQNIQELKKKFIADGGVEEEFLPEQDPYEQDLKDLLNRYRDIKIEQNKKVEEEKEKNLQAKFDIIEELKTLINKQESLDKTFLEFRDLQRKWHETGQVPQSHVKDLWETYNHHVEIFYDYVKINKELRDLDLKRNLETKTKLCEKAEELLLEPSVIKAFRMLQKFHEQWREIGPVPRDFREELWERFKAATVRINKKHQEYFENLKNDQIKNLEAKTALCEKAEEIADVELASHKDWDAKSKELIELQKVWRTIGFAPKKDNNRIYERFRQACDKFFSGKREFYAHKKEDQQKNLQLKIELCELAEAVMESSEWKKTTEELINIQKQWKEIGSVPRRQSDAVWKRFRKACDYFFERKEQNFRKADEAQLENLQNKEVLIEEIKNFKATGDDNSDFESLRAFQHRWAEIGHVPFEKKDDIQTRYRDAINAQFDNLRIDERSRTLTRFKKRVEQFSGSNKGQGQIRNERDKYMSKLKQLESDLTLLENNIGFFANTKNAESLIRDINRKIEKSKEEIEMLKDKIRIIDSSEDED